MNSDDGDPTAAGGSSRRAAPSRRRLSLGLAAGALVEGEVRGVEVEGHLVLVCRIGGRIAALDDVCCHAGCQLSQGRRIGGTIVCPCHDIAFDLATGENRTDPRLCGDQPTRAIVEEGGQLFLVEPER